MHCCKSTPSTRGVALVEAGIVVALLILITFTVFDFGGLFWAFLAFQNGVNQATRFAITNNTLPDPDNPGKSLSRDQSIRQMVRQQTPGFAIADGDITFFNVTTGTPGSSGGPRQTVRVTVTHDWELLTPLWSAVFPGGVATVRVSSTMTNEPPP